MRYGAFRGPRVLTCGKIISATAPGGRFYGDMYREADGPDDMRRAVREQIRAGADFIKVMTTGARSNELEDPDPLQLTPAELSAVADEAHRMGYRLSAHAEGLAGCEAAITIGADTIEHGMFLHQRPDLLDAMAAGGQVLIPTLSGYYWMAGLGDAVSESGASRAPRCRRCWSGWRTTTWSRARPACGPRATPASRSALGSDVRPRHRAGAAADDPARADPAEALVAATRTAARGAGPRRPHRHGAGRQARRPADRRR